MLWIPIIFICAQSCVFMQGQAEFSHTKCLESLVPALEKAASNPNVIAVEGTCIAVTPV